MSFSFFFFLFLSCIYTHSCIYPALHLAYCIWGVVYFSKHHIPTTFSSPGTLYFPINTVQSNPTQHCLAYCEAV